MTIKEYCRENKITYQNLAEAIGCSRIMVQLVATGRKNFSASKIRKLEEVTQGKVKFSDLSLAE